MTQMVCESSLRPDWLATSFKSASDKHQGKVWELAQACIEWAGGESGWEEMPPSRHFERCLTHELGARFETSPIGVGSAHGLSVLTFTGRFFALSSVYAQMRSIESINGFKGRFHYTRLDAQVTTLNPTQSAEQIVTDVRENRLWVKGFKGWEAKGLTDINGNPTGGLSARFGAPSSDRLSTSYNKAAEQDWPVPARRDETRLRGEWAELHGSHIAEAISGASSEDEAIAAYARATGETIAQHMQYIDLNGTPIPRPKNWARGKKAPVWWTETLEQEHTPLKLNRKLENACWKRFKHLEKQYGRTFVECLVDLMVHERSPNAEQAIFDLGRMIVAHASPDDLRAAVDALEGERREDFLATLNEAVNAAAEHSEFV